MEKIEGHNLEQWIEENQCISQEQALNWLEQLIKILDKVHQQGIWHRDIKPSNIILKPDGQLVLIDFGTVGIGTTIIASAQYTPPEQSRGATVLQSDFFALGRTFVYLLTGSHPHELPKSPTTEQLIWRNKELKISDNLAAFIDDLMAQTPENRPKNTQEILQRLQLINNSHYSVTYTPGTTNVTHSANSQVSTASPATQVLIPENKISIQGKNHKFPRKLKVLGTAGIIVICRLAFTTIPHLVSW